MATISITTLIDVLGALTHDTLSGSLYMMDNNKANGSTDLGTEFLKTSARKGDRLVWTVGALEAESRARIVAIEIDEEYCAPREKTYEGTDVTYWVGTVKKRIDKTLPYALKLKVATRDAEMTTPTPASAALSPCLIGPGE